MYFFIYLFIYLSRADRHTNWCVNLLQDRLPVKFQDVKFDPKFKHEIFVKIEMKHSYFSNYFITCLQMFVVFAKILFMLMHNFCSCYIRKF